jgi:hypothetical protein
MRNSILQEARQIAYEAYVYTYPMVLMDLTRLQMSNIEAGKIPGRGPMMTFTHNRAFPEANNREVVRPNFDTLYSFAWLDLTREPAIISVPDIQGRYYMLPLLDMWTDVFAIIGTRATGTKAGHYAIIGPDWSGKLPASFIRIDAPTPYVWVVGRTQTNGPKDYSAVHKIQDAYKLIPLSQWGITPQSIKVKIDPEVDMKTPPLDQTHNMPAKTYFEHAAELMKVHPPHITDQAIVARMRRIGLETGKSLNFDKLDSLVQQSLEKAGKDGLRAMQARFKRLGSEVNGWRVATSNLGVYGNDYLDRAVIAMVGLATNPPEEAIYPVNFADSEGKLVDGNNNYVLHFKKDQLPPVDAFWSITMYDEVGFHSANPLNRFALGDRDDLIYNSDGSLDIYVQHESPGKAKEPNWLPSPKGPLGITLRLYLPRIEALDGHWVPPPIKRMK